VLRFLQERSSKIEEQLDKAKKVEQEAQAFKEKHEQELLNIRKEIQQAKERMEEETRRAHSEIVEKARAEARQERERLREELELERERAKTSLQEEITNTAISLAGEIIKRFIDEKMHRRFVEEFASYLGELNEDQLREGMGRAATSATVYSVIPLPAEDKWKIRDGLLGITRRDIELRFAEDSSLIGGIKIELGDKVIDGSIQAQLRMIQDELGKETV